MISVSIDQKLELLRKIPFFEDFCIEDLLTLADLSYIEAYKEGDVVTEQGSLRMAMHFLINGQLDIFVNDEFVYSFKGGGHVFGEMSFVSNDVASASTIAKSDSTLLCLGVDSLTNLKDPKYYHLRMCLYRACSQALSKRLQASNKTAKNLKEQLEKMNPSEIKIS